MTTSNQQDRTFWDATWTAWAGSIDAPHAATWRNEMDERRLDFLAGDLPHGGVIVEIGAGSGRMLARIGRTTGSRLIGVDYSMPSMRLLSGTAAAFGVQIAPIGGDAFRLPIRTDAVEMVMSGGLLEHFEMPRALLHEMIRILKPGGLFYAGVVPRRTFSIHRPLHRWRAPDVYRSAFSARAYAAWLAELGCEHVTAIHVGVYPPLMQHLPPAPRRAVERVCRRLDGTVVADAVGYGMLIKARKGARS